LTLLMSEKLKSRVSVAALMDEPAAPPPQHAVVKLTIDEIEFTTKLVRLDMHDGLASNITLEAPLNCCQMLLEGYQELDMQVNLNPALELSWVELELDNDGFQILAISEAQCTVVFNKRTPQDT